jgi:uncharacterized protein (DUF1499 family)
MRTILVGSLGLAVLSLALLAVAGPAYRMQLVELRTAFSLLRWAAYGGIAATIGGLLGLVVLRPPLGPTLLVGLLGVVVGAATACVPWSWRQRVRSVPPIHDITTDVEHPPEFVAVLPRRVGARNVAEYGGAGIAAQQQAAYPDIVPLRLPVPAGAAFTRARAAAEGMGWEMVAADSTTGRIEATATTTWFGFKDDVVVRVTAAEAGSRVDVRSVSRVGQSDVGTNAARIRTYLARVAR